MRTACSITLTAAERQQLGLWARGRKTPVRLAQRAQMILLAAEGKQNLEIAAEVGVGRVAVVATASTVHTYSCDGRHLRRRRDRPSDATEYLWDGQQLLMEQSGRHRAGARRYGRPTGWEARRYAG